MALDERSRHELFLRLEEVLGPRPAETLMELMPPVGWADVATKRDLDALEQRMDLRFESIRTLVLANIGAVLSTAALAFAAARLA